MLLRDDPRAAAGRNGDTLLAHITPKEAAMLKRKGGAGTRNPRTGLLEFWDGDGDGEGPGDDGSSGRSSEVTPGIAGEVDPSNSFGFGEGYSGPGMANPGFFSDPMGWAAYQAQQAVSNPVATLANVGLSPLGLPYASQALNALAETVGKGIASLTGTDPNAVGPAGSEATAGGGGVDPSTGQPTGAPTPADGGFKPLSPEQLAAAARPGANPATPAGVRAADPQAQAARMAYGLLGRGKDAAMGPAAPAQRVGGGQQQRPTVYDFMPGARPRQGLLTG